MVVLGIMILAACTETKQSESTTENTKPMVTEEKYTFELSDNVTREKVSFKNKYGITLA